MKAEKKKTVVSILPIPALNCYPCQKKEKKIAQTLQRKEKKQSRQNKGCKKPRFPGVCLAVGVTD